MKIAVAVLASLTLCCLLLWSIVGGPDRGLRAEQGERESRTAAGHLELAAPAAIAQRAAELPAHSSARAPDASTASTDTDLVSLLARIGFADATGDEVALAQLLPRIVGSGDRLLATLDLLEQAELVGHAHARRGALLVLSIGVARWARGGGPPDRDGVALTIEVLTRLPRLDEDSRSELTALIAGADIEGRAALDGRYLEVVLSLCREQPDQAFVYARLLERLADDPAQLQPFAERLRGLVAENNAPAVQALALRALFAVDPQSGTAAAQELVTAARGDAALREAVALTIARAAPAESAVELLLELRDSGQHAAFAALADRPEARGAVKDHYNRLAASGMDPTGRKILVASMRAEEPGLLLGIAESDPSTEVRLQAFLTGTLQSNDSVESVRSLRTAYERRADPRIGISTRGAVLSANNIVLNSRGRQREEALGLLAHIARDSTAAFDERMLALRKLRPHVPADSIADLGDLGGDSTQSR